MGKRQNLARLQFRQIAHANMDGGEPEIGREFAVEHPLAKLIGLQWRIDMLVVGRLLRQLSKQRVRGHRGERHVEHAARIRHLDFKAERETPLVGRHQDGGLGNLLPLIEFELYFQDWRPGGLQFPDNDSNDGLQYFFLNFREIAHIHRPGSRSSEDQIYDREGKGQVQLHDGQRVQRHEANRAKVRQFGQPRENFGIVQLLDGDKVHFEPNP